MQLACREHRPHQPLRGGARGAPPVRRSLSSAAGCRAAHHQGGKAPAARGRNAEHAHGSAAPCKRHGPRCCMPCSPWRPSVPHPAACRGCSPSRGPRAPGRSTPLRAAPRCCCLRRPPRHPLSGPAAPAHHGDWVPCTIHLRHFSWAAGRPQPHLDQDLHYFAGEVASSMQCDRHAYGVHSERLGSPHSIPARDLSVSNSLNTLWRQQNLMNDDECDCCNCTAHQSSITPDSSCVHSRRRTRATAGAPLMWENLVALCPTRFPASNGNSCRAQGQSTRTRASEEMGTPFHKKQGRVGRGIKRESEPPTNALRQERHIKELPKDRHTWRRCHSRRSAGNQKARGVPHHILRTHVYKATVLILSRCTRGLRCRSRPSKAHGRHARHRKAKATGQEVSGHSSWCGQVCHTVGRNRGGLVFAAAPTCAGVWPVFPLKANADLVRRSLPFSVHALKLSHHSNLQTPEMGFPRGARARATPQPQTSCTAGTPPRPLVAARAQAQARGARRRP